MLLYVLMICTLFVYLVLAILAFVFKLGWKLFKFVFKVGLFVVLPIYLIFAIISGTIVATWYFLVGLFAICLLAVLLG